MLTRLVFAAILALMLGCGSSSPTAPSLQPPTNQTPIAPSPPDPNPNPALPAIPVDQHADHDILAVGDIAQCRPGTNEAPNAFAVGQLARRLLATFIVAVGDIVYNDADPTEYARCFDFNWGHQTYRIKPALGNHEYTPRAPNAEGFFQYFGGTAGPGYYSFNLGSWHHVVLNSEIVVNSNDRNNVEARRQMEWLTNDLSLYRNWQCTIAYWHHPRFTTGPNGNHDRMDAIVRLLYDHRVDVIVNGHDHMYKRYNLRDAAGFPDQARGFRQFIVGTGGASLYDEARPGSSQEPYIKQFGLLRLGLRLNGYTWEFLSENGRTLDSNSDSCR